MVAAKLLTRFGWSLNVLEDPTTRISELPRDNADGETLLVYYYRWGLVYLCRLCTCKLCNTLNLSHTIAMLLRAAFACMNTELALEVQVGRFV
jgi:hypothetical protein